MQLIEHYLSLQGEGLHSGKPTYFVRFARCNLRCQWCDTSYSFGKGTLVSFNTVTSKIKESRAKFVCLTGGEPLLHTEDCIQLMRHAPQLHFDIETGGSLDIQPFQVKNSSIIMDWKLEHSGMNHKMKQDNLLYLRPEQDLLKFVTDGSSVEKSEILQIIEKTKNRGFQISIQPVFGCEIQPIADWLLSLKNPCLQFNLQLHKLIWAAHPVGI